MAVHKWTMLCRKALIDDQSEDVTLVDVIDKVRVTADLRRSMIADRIAGNTDLAVVVMRSDPSVPEDLWGSIRVVFPDASFSHGPVFRIDMTSAQGSRIIIRSEHIPVKGDGNHTFVVAVKGQDEDEWRDVSSYSYEVEFDDDDR